MFENLIDHLVFHLYYQVQAPKWHCRRLVPLCGFWGSLDLCAMTTESQLHIRETLSGGQGESTQSKDFSSLLYLWFQQSSPHLPVRWGISARRARGLELLSFETVLWFQTPSLGHLSCPQTELVITPGPPYRLVSLPIFMRDEAV